MWFFPEKNRIYFLAQGGGNIKVSRKKGKKLGEKRLYPFILHICNKYFTPNTGGGGEGVLENILTLIIFFMLIVEDIQLFNFSTDSWRS